MKQINPIIADLKKGQELEVATGIFVVQKKAVWIYPAYVTEKETAFKEAKEKSQQLGDAKYTEITFVKFNVNKE